MVLGAVYRILERGTSESYRQKLALYAKRALAQLNPPPIYF